MDAQTITLLQTIVPALISAVCTYLVASKQNKTTVADINQKHNEQLTLILYRIEQLEKAVAKHNNIVERITVLEAKANLKKEN